MSNEEYRRQVIEYGRGERSLQDMPLAEVGFWRQVLLLAARPGRDSNKAPYIGAAAEALLRQRLQPEAVAARERAALSLLADPNARVRRLAVQQLTGVTDGDTVKALQQAATSSDKDLAVQAVRVLARQRSPDAYAALADVLASSSDLRTVAAAEALVGAGVDAIPYLEKLLDQPDRLTRWRATSCLAELRRKEALPALLRALHDDSVDVAWLAADGLLALGPSVREEVLRSVLESPIKAATARALRHYAEHASPRRIFREIIEATQGLATLSALPVAVEHALEALQR